MWKNTILTLLVFITLSASAQTSDSLIVHTLQAKGIRFSHDNKVKLLKSGQTKFDNMFEAIRQAKSSVHLEYFNFRNDSIASLLFDIDQIDGVIRAAHLALTASNTVFLFAFDDGNFFNLGDFQYLFGAEIHADAAALAAFFNNLKHL